MKKFNFNIVILVLLFSCHSNEDNHFSVNDIIAMESIDALNLSKEQKVEVALALVARYNIKNNIEVKEIDPDSEAYKHLDVFRKMCLSSYVSVKTEEILNEIDLRKKYVNKFQNARSDIEAADIGLAFNQEVDSIRAKIEKKAKTW